jgi:hypothetical protein
LFENEKKDEAKRILAIIENVNDPKRFTRWIISRLKLENDLPIVSLLSELIYHYIK